MSTNALTTEYEAWLDKQDKAGHAVPRLSADEALYELLDANDPNDRPTKVKEQILWLDDFISRWRTTQNAEDICTKWVRKIGIGFHPDTPASNYSPPLTPEDAAAYDRDMKDLFTAQDVIDPYAIGLAAMESAGLCP